MPTARIILLSVLIATAAHADSWTDLSPLTQPRQETGAAHIGGRVYVCGGLILGNPSRNTPTVEVYTIADDRWDPAPDMPLSLDHLGVAALDGDLYIVGGYTRSEAGVAQSTNEVHRLTGGGSEWEPLATMPESRAGHWAVAHRGRIYVFGGVQSGVGIRDAVLIYDPTTNQWNAGSEPMPTPREHLNAVSAGPYIYVCGGRASGTSFTALERYDPVADEWETMAPMFTARAATVFVPFGSKLYCMGGETPMLFDVNEVYDILSDEWATATPMAIPRHGIAAVTLDDRILCPAGGIIQGLMATNAVDAYLPDYSAADIGGGPGVNAIDIQLAINALLGLDTGSVNADIDADGELTATDIQRAINAALGL